MQMSAYKRLWTNHQRHHNQFPRPRNTFSKIPAFNMRPFIIISALLVATVNANGYGGQSQSSPSAGGYSVPQQAPVHMHYQMTPMQPAQSPSYGNQVRAPAPVETVRVSYNSGSDTRASSYGGASDMSSSYGAAPSAPASYGAAPSAPASYAASSDSYSSSSSRAAPAPVETVRISFNSESADSGYSAGDSSSSSYGTASSSAPASSSDSGAYSHSSSDSSSYGTRSVAPVETVRVSYNSGSSSYGGASSDSSSGYGSNSMSSDSGAYSHSSGSSESYGTRSVAPVETVRVSYNSGSSSYGGASSDSSSSGYGNSGSSDSGAYSHSSGSSDSYGTRTAPVETVRVSYNSGSSNTRAGSSYGASSAPASSYGSSSYGSSTRNSYGNSGTRNAVPILKYNQEITAGTRHNYDFATGDGISHSEVTQVRGGTRGSYGTYGSSSGESNAEVAKEGSYSYTAPDGQRISLNYQADAQGFRAQGAHLPTPPPIPAEIAKSLRGNGY